MELNFRSPIQYLEDFALTFDDFDLHDTQLNLMEYEAVIYAFYMTKTITGEQFDHFLNKCMEFQNHIDLLVNATTQ